MQNNLWIGRNKRDTFIVGWRLVTSQELLETPVLYQKCRIAVSSVHYISEDACILFYIA